MGSIRKRLLAGTLLGAGVVMGALGLWLYHSTRAILRADFDHVLAAKARALAALVEEEDGEYEAEFASIPSSEFTRSDRPEYYLLRDGNHHIIMRSPSLAGADLRFDATAERGDAGSLTLPDGRPGRYAAVRFTPRSEGRRKSKQQLVLIVSRDTLDLNRTLGQFGFVLLVAGGAGLAVLSAWLFAVVRAGVKPLHAVAGQIDALDAVNLSQRLPARDLPAELVPVVNCLNALLTKLEAAFAREKSFTADVAHDLRTPLAGLRSTLEVALSRERGPAEYRQSIAEALAVTQDMQAMTDNLLALARAEAGQIAVQRESVDLQALVQSAWNPYASAASARGLRTAIILSPDARACTDRRQLSAILRQLFDNAVAYAGSGGEIRIEARPDESRVRIEVSNTGNHLAPADVDRVFDRFWRGDTSRVKPGLHCGLGLSLARRITELLGGTIRAEARGDWFAIVLELPAV